MRIAQVTMQLRQAGTEQVVLDLSTALVRRGHEVEVISLMSLPNRSRIVDGLREHRIPMHSLELRKTTPWRALRLQSVIDRIRPDVVHTHMFHSNVLSRLGPRRHPYRLLNTVHGVERRATREWQFIIERWTRSRAGLQTAVSRAVRDFHAPRVGISADAMPVVYNGIHSPPPLDPGRAAALRKEWGVDSCSRVLGSVGRLHRQKGYDVLLEMLPVLSEMVPRGERWGLVILGDGSERRRLDRLARSAPPEFQVCLPGFRADASQCIGAFDLFLMPSRYEGFGLSLAEAMAHGVPSVVNQTGALPEILDTYMGGRVVDFRKESAPTVSSSIRELLTSEREERTPVLPFTIDAMVDGYLDLYRGAVKSGQNVSS